MISKMAMEDIDSLAAEGINLTPQEIIRLNAFGLKVEKGTDAAEQFALPRVALLGDLQIRQPTIGSEIWMRKASQVCDMEQVNTFIMLRLYSLSKDQSELCDPHDKESILSEVEELTDKVSPFTLDQIMAALDFAQHGRNPQDCEQKGKNKKANEDDDDEEDDYLDEEYECVEIGMLKDGLVLRLGTIAELKGMTTSCLHLLLEYARQMEFGEANLKHTKNKRMIEYYCVLDEIKSAHKKDEMTEESNNG